MPSPRLLALLAAGFVASATAAASAALVACSDPGPRALPSPSPTDTSEPGGPAEPTELTVGNWNLEWFGSTEMGPTNDPLQQSNAAKVLTTLAADMWAVQEIVDPAALRQLAIAGGDYAALVSNDPGVNGGPSVYDSPTGLKLGLLYKADRVDVRVARVLFADDLNPFNGRAPLEVELTTKPGGTTFTLVVVHLSPGTDAASYEKRKQATALLKTYADAKPEGTRLMIAGDFNDGLEKSSYSGAETPFSPFLEDTSYKFATLGLSSPRYPRLIDHQLVTDDLAADLVAKSARVVDGDTVVRDYISTTSDHDPVVVRYALP